MTERRHSGIYWANSEISHKYSYQVSTSLYAVFDITKIMTIITIIKIITTIIIEIITIYCDGVHEIVTNLAVRYGRPDCNFIFPFQPHIWVGESEPISTQCGGSVLPL